MKPGQKIFFGSKEENNERRLKEALARTPHERFMFFLKLVEEMHTFDFSEQHPNIRKNNFVIE